MMLYIKKLQASYRSLKQKLNQYMMRSSLQEKIRKNEKAITKLKAENDELKASLDLMSKSLVLATKTIDEVAFIQKTHLLQTEQLFILVDDLAALLQPKNDYLRYDLTKEPHN